ncbi:hyaluronate lyase [Actinokineospora globicatena]|nr:hyaluronate lyase [Actinokineospora globicatena]GLW79172.1 lyase [Actinokineospora globicatena]GLW86418.1 lyase [Actinokineospora globicatena]
MVAGGVALGLVTGAVPAAATEFAALRVRWRDLVLGSGFNPTVEPFRGRLVGLGTNARNWWGAMNRATGSLWPDAVFADPEPDEDPESIAYSGKIRDSYERLLVMATAYSQPGTGLTHDSTLLTDVLLGLRRLHDQVYNKDQAEFGNWWHWQIGAPQALLDIYVLLYDRIPATDRADYLAAVDHFVPDGAVADRPGVSLGSNRVDLCRVLALRGAVGDNAGKLAVARDALTPAMAHVTSGDGLYPDGSFIQHQRLPYAGAYGVTYVHNLGTLFTWLAESSWRIVHLNREIVLGSVEKTWAPLILDGLVFDAVSGRAISRGLRTGATTTSIPEDDHARGHVLIAGIALLAKGAEPTTRARWQGLVKGWIERDGYKPVLNDPAVDFASLVRLNAIAADPAVVAAPEPTDHRLFPETDRAVHRRPGWAAVVSMASRRIAHYEFLNGENSRGWHTGAGMVTWWGDRGQYSDGFWPTVDPYRLPGTTVSTKRLVDGQEGDGRLPVPDADWAGGATDGTYAALGQDLRGLASSMSARKSWFFVDDAVICLGSAIKAGDDVAVETVVDNRNLRGSATAALTVNGVAVPEGVTVTPKTRWAHLDGHAGYLFPVPDGATLTTLREQRTGRWRDINIGGATLPITRRYQTLWLDHGVNPTDGTYRYVVLPGATAARTAARATTLTSWLPFVVNTPAAQGIELPEIGVTAVNFWAAGTTSRLSATVACSVLARVHPDGTATFCVAAPTRKVNSLTVTWHRPIAAVLSKPTTVAATHVGTSLRVDFTDLAATRGATQVVRVRL